MGPWDVSQIVPERAQWYIGLRKLPADLRSSRGQGEPLRLQTRGGRCGDDELIRGRSNVTLLHHIVFPFAVLTRPILSLKNIDSIMSGLYLTLKIIDIST